MIYYFQRNNSLVSTILNELRSQCVNYSIILITEEIEGFYKLSKIFSPLTEFMMEGIIPRGFINELLTRTALKPEVFELVKQTFKYSLILL